MSILISGSLAYDYIMDFPDSFQKHILPDQLHILNVSFMVNKLEKGFGGTAGNIAYTVKLLGGNPLPVSALGQDSADYVAHFAKYGINTDGVIQDKTILTASAYITTDNKDNQISAFFPGPLERAQELKLTQIAQPIETVLISPTHKNVMRQHLEQSRALGCVTVFDPGQQMSSFDQNELRTMVTDSDFIIGNDYEIKLLQEKTGWNVSQIVDKKRTLITTLGEQGSVIRLATGESISVKSCPPAVCTDPTGAGDAYRAGFFVGFSQNLPIRTCAQMGSVAASFAIECYGTQAHHFTPAEFAKRYQNTYHEEIVNS